MKLKIALVILLSCVIAGVTSVPGSVRASVVPDTSPPSHPANVTATAVTVGNRYGARIKWTAATDNVGVDRYVITRLQIDEGPVAQFVVPGSQTTYDDLIFSINAGADTTFYYSIEAFDVAGNVSYRSNTAVFSTITPRFSPPRPWLVPQSS